MTCSFEQLTQTDPTPRGAGSAYEGSYVYGRNSPMRYTDPSGLRATECKAPDWKQTFKLFGQALNPFGGDFNACQNRQAQTSYNVISGYVPGSRNPQVLAATTIAVGNPVTAPAIGPAVGVTAGVGLTIAAVVTAADVVEDLTKPRPKRQRLFRYGGWPESQERLQFEAEKASATAGFFFGVSTSLRKHPSQSNKCAPLELCGA